MCGLSGYWLLNGRKESDTAAIIEMLRLLEHRGPDDSGIVGINPENNALENKFIDQIQAFSTSPSLIFGFNRLSILDLSLNGHQPMISDDRSVVMMMNGEIYNAFEYKSVLESKGFRFKSQTDTEVVMYLYQAFGLHEMLERLNGMFAIVLYDIKIEKLFLIRDRIGIKPLYYYMSRDTFAFASELKCFKALPGFQYQLDKRKLSEFLLFRNAINQTLFDNIINLDPGHYLELSKNNKLIKTAYYNIRNEGALPVQIFDPLEAEQKLKFTLKNAVKRQMISDVKLGCQLSGGVDSSMITLFASELVSKGSLETISIIFKNPRFTEKNYIDEVANKLNLVSHQYTLLASDYINMFEEATWHFEQPLNHPSTIGIKLLSREAGNHVTVLLSGEGADEVLAGYNHFLPSNQKILSRNFLGGLKMNKSEILQFLPYWLDKDNRFLLQRAFMSMSTAKRLYSGFSMKKAMMQRKRIWHELTGNLNLKQRKYEILAYLPDLLMRQDKMSMAHSIENRVPFLDNDMVSLSLSMSDNLVIGKQSGRYESKHILKKLCESHFGGSFAYRKKMGFGIPLAEFFSANDFKQYWYESVYPGIESRKIFNAAPMVKWMDNPPGLSPDKLDALWLMTGFEIWAKQYLD